MLGISIYPDKTSYNELKDYVDQAHKYGFKRIFTCLLSVGDDIELIKKEYTDIIEYSVSLGFEVILDVSPAVFSKLNISYNDLSFFKELGATGIRLDENYNGKLESDMTYNQYDLDIEINMSLDAPYVNNILAYEPIKSKLFGCHNFYPQRYSGLGFAYFEKTSNRFKELNVRSACFVYSQVGKVGPWPIMDGMSTLEMHRDLDIVTQVKHLLMTGLVDDIIISNQGASTFEMEQLSKLSAATPTFKIELSKNSDLENKIIFDEAHFNRGDVNEYTIRSTQSRVKYKDHDFKCHDTNGIVPRGAVVIGNDNFGQYKGELQIIKQDILDPELTRNIVGYITGEELFLLDLLKPWQTFKFSK